MFGLTSRPDGRAGQGLLCLLTILVVAGVGAAQTDKHAAAQELVSTLGATQTAKAIFQTLIVQYSSALAKDSMDAFEHKNWPAASKEKAKALSEQFYAHLSDRLRNEVPQRIGYDEKVTGIYVDYYEKYFTDSEIRELIAFYKTPLGQKFLSFGPAMSAQIQQRASAEIEPQTLTVTREIVDEELKNLAQKASQLETTNRRP